MAAWRSSSQRSTVRAGPDGLRATGTARQRDPGAGHVNETPAAHARRRRGVCGRRRHAWLAEGRAAGAGVALLGAGRDDPGRQSFMFGQIRYGSARQSRHSWAGREVGGFCCPVPPEPRLSLMQRQRAPLCCHWHLSYGPITAEPCRAKDTSLPRVSSLCRPHVWRFCQDGGGAGHCPRVHYAYSTHRLSP